MSPYEMHNPLHHQKNAIAAGTRVSIEKQQFVSSGIVKFIEGDIIEIEMTQYKFYQLGDVVKVTVYSSNGFQILQSSVVARDIGLLTIINPPENQRLTSRRQHPRIEVSHIGVMESLRRSEIGEQLLPEPLPIRIQNISLCGIGFILPADPGVRTLMVADMMLNISGGIDCSIEISRKEAASEQGVFVGARITRMPPEQQMLLRGFILRTQIQLRSRMRRSDGTAV